MCENPNCDHCHAAPNGGTWQDAAARTALRLVDEQHRTAELRSELEHVTRNLLICAGCAIVLAGVCIILAVQLALA